MGLLEKNTVSSEPLDKIIELAIRHKSEYKGGETVLCRAPERVMPVDVTTIIPVREGCKGLVGQQISSGEYAKRDQGNVGQRVGHGNEENGGFNRFS